MVIIPALTLLFLSLEAFEAAAYTVEKRDEPVTGQFVISPVKVELNLSPGQKVTRDITVSNRTGDPISLTFTVEDFEGSLDPAESHVFLGGEDSAWGARDWIDPELTTIELEQGETVTFEVRISVPADAEPGGHYAAVFAEAEEIIETEEEPGGVRFTSRVGALFLITVAGEVDSRGTINEPEVPVITDFGPIDVGIVFNNLGNIHQSPSGRVLITNFLGQAVAEIPVQEWVVLPESSRRTAVRWEDKWHLGPYKVRAEITYGDDGEVLYATSTVWFFPWKIMLAAAAGLFIIIFFATLVLRKRKRTRRQIREELEELRTLKEAGAGAEPEAAVGEELPGTPVEAAGEPSGTTDLVPLSELLPSMHDESLVDISDQETRQLIRTLINNEMDLARSFILEGKYEDARRELTEARAAALRLQLLSEVAVIDDLMQYL